ncbi:hypothetical protein F5Y18DRAFT_259542 [Xylariaceae sp. FL1019]|nr:hypothetical protein F5Y18DRAFT_259542 [Xylariaceae sp. FL1019]
MGFFEKIQQRFEIYRLEQRYTRNRHRRSTFVSNAMYVDGEYVYQTPSSTGSSSNSSAVTTPTEEVARRSLEVPTPSSHRGPSSSRSQAPQSPERRKLHRFSSMPGFGAKQTTRKEW